MTTLMTTHLEVNFQRLLVKCEELAEKQDSEEWRYEKYVNSLEDYLKQLNKLTTNKPSIDTLKDYNKRVEFLKKLGRFKSKESSIAKEIEPNVVNKLQNPGPILTQRDMKAKQIYHKAQIDQEKQLRQSLLGVDKSKKNTPAEAQNSDINKLIAEQNQTQERIANEMLESVRAIKEKTQIANKIVKKDNKRLEEINSDADRNQENLNRVNEKLSARVSRSCNCWIWLVILLVMIVFIMMVLFMKLFSKRKYYESTGASESADELYKSYLSNTTIYIDNSTIHNEL